jgi:hypothetical protein
MKIFTVATMAAAIAVTSGVATAAPGYKGGASLPSSYSQTIWAHNKGVIANDGLDDSAEIQAIIDSIDINNSPNNLIRILLPAGEITLNNEVHVDRSGVLIEGRGTGESSGTHIVVNSWKPYTVASDGAPEFDKKYWPGFGAFRAETRVMHPNEPAYEGSINFHWKHSIEIVASANKGDTVLKLENNGASKFNVGDLIYVGAANDDAFLDEGQVPSSKRSKSHIKTGHMRTQIFHVAAVNTSDNTVTIDEPLEFNIEPTNSTGYKSRVMPVTAVQNVGFRKFTLTMNQASTECANYNTGNVSASNPNGVGHRYENVCAEDAIHGLIFKWADDSFVDDVKIEMMGSHPIVTEFAKSMTFQNIKIDGSWNKGAGGNGYFRGSKLYDSLIKGNTIENVRHLTLQWSATGNVVENNTLNVDMNLHGGWERNNIIRNNTIAVPFEHRSWENGAPGDGTWQPIWYGSGDHATNWSGPTGPNNVFINNTLKKAKTAGASITRWGLFDTPNVPYAFAWDGANFKHLNIDGTQVETWTQEIAEAVYAQMPNSGVLASGDTDPVDPDPVDPDPVDPDPVDPDPVDPGSCVNTINVPWNARTEVTLSAGACLKFDRDLTNETVQVWDSDANSSCDFRGTFASVDGSGSMSITSNYASSKPFSGTTLQVQAGYSCDYVKVRAY